VESLKRWMAATKPLIKNESEFIAFADDFVAMNKDVEQGFLEEVLEEFVTKFGWGLNVSGSSLSLVLLGSRVCGKEIFC
jgi:hypothetical protein